MGLQEAYQACIDVCNYPYIGYNQDYRTTLDMSVTYRTYCDCSSLMAYCMTVGGYFTRNPWFTTSGQISDMLNAGWIEQPLSGEWKAGDILWYRYEGENAHGHTEMVYSGGTGSGILMGAHGRNNRAFPDQVSIRSSPSNYTQNWMKLLRAPDGEVVPYDPPDIPPVPGGDPGVPTDAMFRAQVISELQRRYVILGRH